MENQKICTAIIGASGYSGIELVKILLQHPRVELAHVIGASTVGKRIAEIYPQFRQRTDLTMEPYQFETLKKMDFVFLALPHGEALKRVPELIDAGLRVIDLSGDFRFESPAVYEKWYHLPHTAGKYLEQAVYGMPELFRAEIRACQLLANPGCYPTGAILALAPLLADEQLGKGIALDAIAITAMSGTSGAGRKEKLELLFAEVNESVKAYKVGNHQHTPEIKATLERLAGRTLDVVFIPHLIPLTRGIYTTICLPLKEQVARETIVQEIGRAHV